MARVFESVIGIDEVGRGSWAGPVVAAAVVLRCPISELRDSKALTARQRRVVARQIRQCASAVGIGWVGADLIDQHGLQWAIRQAMLKALAQTDGGQPIIIDGNINFLHHMERATCLIKADATVPSVSAASVIAKVARDTFMKRLALRYPDYAFERHVGYGTAQHLAALRASGTCELHRRSYKPVRKAELARVD